MLPLLAFQSVSGKLTASQATRDHYHQAEARAQAAQLNVWSQSNPIMPWDLRQGERMPPPSPVPTSPTEFPACFTAILISSPDAHTN